MGVIDTIESIKSLFGGSKYEANKAAIDNVKEALLQLREDCDRANKKIERLERAHKRLSKRINSAIKVSYNCPHVKDNGILQCPAWNSLTDEENKE